MGNNWGMTPGNEFADNLSLPSSSSQLAPETIIKLMIIQVSENDAWMKMVGMGGLRQKI